VLFACSHIALLNSKFFCGSEKDEAVTVGNKLTPNQGEMMAAVNFDT
jgi:hypothetical protein